MRISTFVHYRWIDGAYRLIREEGFEYSGPLALADRGQAKAVSQQGRTQSAQDQANAQASLAATNKSVGDYNRNLGSFMKFGRATYGPNGEFLRDQNTLANTTAAAGANKIGGDLATNAFRTGENTAGYAGTLAESQREASRNLAAQLAKSDADRLEKLTALEQYGVDASKFPAGVYEALYGTGTSGSAAQLNPAAKAAAQPSFFQQFGQDIIGAAGGAAAGALGCWIAAAVYDGWLDPRTVLVREWLNTEFIKRPLGRVVMALYLRFGEQIAGCINRHRWLRHGFRPLF